jgi:hypothetical protein
MRLDTKSSVFLVACAALALLASGCGELDDDTIPTHIVYGRLTSTSVNPSGKDGLVKVVGPSEDILADALYSGSCAFSGPTCEYRIHWVLEGSYTIFAFVDMNNNAAYDLPVPDSGDLIALGRALILWDTTEIDFDDEAWHVML